MLSRALAKQTSPRALCYRFRANGSLAGLSDASLPKEFERIKRKLDEQGFISVGSDTMHRVLPYFGAGGDKKDFLKICGNLPADPKWPHIRSIQNGRLAYDPDAGEITRRVRTPFVLNKNEVVHEDITSVPRDFGEIPNETMINTWFQAYMRLLFALAQKMPLDAQVVDGTDASSRTWLGNIFPIRIRTDPSKQAGKPTPEGVHQDGCALNAVLFLGERNLHPEAGTSRLFNMNQPKIDIPAEEVSEHEIARHTMRMPLEAQIFYDRRVQHDATPLVPKDPRLGSSRDVLVSFVRKPGPQDPMETHSSMPCRFSLGSAQKYQVPGFPFTDRHLKA